MSQQQAHSLRLERTLNAPPAKVRQALLDPSLLAKWFAPGDMSAEVHACDAVVGGQYEISMVGKDPEGNEARHTCTGVFQELSDQRIVMTFNWSAEPLPNDTLLTYHLEAVEGGTKLTMVHEGFPAQEMADMHTEGWTGCLDKLPDALA